MNRRRLGHDSSVAPNGATADPNTTGHPKDRTLDSSSGDEMAPTTRHQWAQEIQSAKDEQSAKVKKLVKAQPPAKSQQSARDNQPSKSQQLAEGKQPSQNTKPPEETRKDQRPSVLDDPKLASRSRKIDKYLGFPGGSTKENADEWLNKKIGYIQQQTQERNAKSWDQLKNAREFITSMRKGVLPGSNEIPPPLLDVSDNEPPRKRTRAQRRMSQEARDKAFLPAKKDHAVAATQSDDDTDGPESSENRETPSDEGAAQSNPEGQKTAKRRPRANELDTNLGEGWNFKKVTSKGRPSKSRD